MRMNNQKYAASYLIFLLSMIHILILSCLITRKYRDIKVGKLVFLKTNFLIQNTVRNGIIPFLFYPQLWAKYPGGLVFLNLVGKQSARKTNLNKKKIKSVFGASNSTAKNYFLREPQQQ